MRFETLFPKRCPQHNTRSDEFRTLPFPRPPTHNSKNYTNLINISKITDILLMTLAILDGSVRGPVRVPILIRELPHSIVVVTHLIYMNGRLLHASA